jgi:hypothetical protein
MKNRIKLSAAVLVLLFASSCSSDQDSNSEIPKTELSKKKNVESSSYRIDGVREDFSKINETTTVFSRNLLKLGVSKIIRTGSEFSFSTVKDFRIYDQFYNMSNYLFDYSDNTLKFKNNSAYEIFSINNELYLSCPSYEGLVRDLDAEVVKNDKNLIFLMTFLGEMTAEQSEKIEYEDGVAEENARYGGGCSFWNTYYTYGVGANGAAAYANFVHNFWDDVLNHYENCRNIGGAEHSTIGMIHYYTMAFCC